MKHDDLSERLQQHGNWLYGIGTPAKPMTAPDFLDAGARIDRLQAELDAARSAPLTINVPAAQVLPAATIQERYVTARERYEGVEAELTEFGETLPVGTELFADKPACERKPLDFSQMHKVTSEAHIAFCLGKFDSFEVALIRHTEKAHGVEEKT